MGYTIVFRSKQAALGGLLLVSLHCLLTFQIVPLMDIKISSETPLHVSEIGKSRRTNLAPALEETSGQPDELRGIGVGSNVTKTQISLQPEPAKSLADGLFPRMPVEMYDFVSDDEQRILKLVAAVQEDFIINVTNLYKLTAQSFRGNGFCNMVASKMESLGIGNTTSDPKNGRLRIPLVRPSQPLLVDVPISSFGLFHKNIGTGNFVDVLYGIRLAAQRIGNIHVQFRGTDSIEQQTDLILPWLTGVFPASDAETSRLEKLISIEQACDNFHKMPLQHILAEMRLELQRMTVALVGIPEPKHPYASFAERQRNIASSTNYGYKTMEIPMPPLDQPHFPGVELDDVALHFRGGDLMMSGDVGHGFLKFSALAKIISPEARSIGIVTQPFQGQRRKGDSHPEKERRARVLLGAMQEYLRERFPNARISLRNDPKETVALSYARMISANQTIAGLSSFSIFPALSSFGSGYVRKSDKESMYLMEWVNGVPNVNDEKGNIFLIDVPLLTPRRLKEMWAAEDGENQVLEWFRSGN